MTPLFAQSLEDAVEPDRVLDRLLRCPPGSVALTPELESRKPVKPEYFRIVVERAEALSERWSPTVVSRAQRVVRTNLEVNAKAARMEPTAYFATVFPQGLHNLSPYQQK